MSEQPLPEKAQMTDAEAEVWDEFWETDAARCCSCPSCNYYAPDYEQHKGEPCLLTALFDRIFAARLRGLASDSTARAVLAKAYREAGLANAAEAIHALADHVSLPAGGGA